MAGIVKKQSSSKKASSTPEQFNEEVRKVAYELYEKRGYAHGNHLEDWVEAEKLVKERGRG